MANHKLKSVTMLLSIFSNVRVVVSTVTNHAEANSSAALMITDDSVFITFQSRRQDY